MMDMGERLRALRKEKKWTQEETADLINRQRGTYVAWEKAHREPGIADLAALADLFGVSIDYLVGRSPDKSISLGLGGLEQIVFPESVQKGLYEMIRAYTPPTRNIVQYVNMASMLHYMIQVFFVLTTEGRRAVIDYSQSLLLEEENNRRSEVNGD